jgi:hypothetical protein
MALLKRILRAFFARAEAVFDWSFGQSNNPFSNLGALGWYFFWIVAASGIYLYLFFDTGITDAYLSVEYITNDQWYAAGIMRSLHRYASDALVIVVFLHILREFSLDRLRGKRFFAWITGVPLLWFIYMCGITGYWLVWDSLAQYIAIAGVHAYLCAVVHAVPDVAAYTTSRARARESSPATRHWHRHHACRAVTRLSRNQPGPCESRCSAGQCQSRLVLPRRLPVARCCPRWVAVACAGCRLDRFIPDAMAATCQGSLDACCQPAKLQWLWTLL